MRLVVSNSLCAAGIALFVFALAACGDGQAGESVARKGQQTTEEPNLIRDDLAAMIPTRAEVSARRGRGFEPEEARFESYAVSHRSASPDTPDFNDSASDLKRQARTGGYQAIFYTADLSVTLAHAKAIVHLSHRGGRGRPQTVSRPTSSRWSRSSGIQKFSVSQTDVHSARPALCGGDSLHGTGSPADTEAGYEDIQVCVVGFRIGRVVGWARLHVSTLDPAIMATNSRGNLKPRCKGCSS